MINMCGAKYFEALVDERKKQEKAFIKKHKKETQEMLYDLSINSKCDIGSIR